MEQFLLRGGARLAGRVRVSGAKNAALPLMAASLMSRSQCVIENIPDLEDVRVMGEVLEQLGAKLKRQDSALIIDTSHVNSVEVPENLTRKMRASNLVMGALIARFGEARVAQPGGCAIGSRPMDLHIKGFKNLGCMVNEKHGSLLAQAEKLEGRELLLDFPSVGATENLMMAACMAEGTTIIRNAAREPEILDLQNFLNRMGARIRGAGLDTIRIEGVRYLDGTRHEVIPDRIEAGTMMVAAAITGGDIFIENVIIEHLEPLSAKLSEAGIEVLPYPGAIRVRANSRPDAVDIKTMPYPGFPTDMQPQIMALLSLASGSSLLVETIFENRFMHVSELRRMGADIRIEGRVAIIRGKPALQGAVVAASDLRAGAALILAGLAADGETRVENIYHLDRGYERIEQKLSQLGALISRIEN
ncbi:MAG: UDP-N-acetylglucosamine 1-carboxyvinyltransferase [Methylocystaceae bacterium]